MRAGVCSCPAVVFGGYGDNPSFVALASVEVWTVGMGWAVSAPMAIPSEYFGMVQLNDDRRNPLLSLAPLPLFVPP